MPMWIERINITYHAVQADVRRETEERLIRRNSRYWDNMRQE